MPSVTLLEAVAVTAELCGRVFSEPAARVFVDDLSVYPEHQVLGALKRCRKEVRGVLTVSDVVQRLDDGRPGPDEAWAQMPMDDRTTTVWCDEMAKAFGVALPLLDAGEPIAARMAFRDAYRRLCDQARDAGILPNWTVSEGLDRHQRALVLEQAVRDGKLALEHAQQHMPALPAPAAVLAMLPRLAAVGAAA